MRFENTDVWGFEHAIRGMQNILESCKKSDSGWETHLDYNKDEVYTNFAIGENDLELMQKLIKVGSEHRKFMHQIVASVDITAPLYWWEEFDTYKVGIIANSTSTIHKLASTQITMDCFENGEMIYSFTIAELEMNRLKYLETKDENELKKLIVNLPESWLQTRTVTMNYENIRTMIQQHTNHKLTEWSKDFIEWAKTLPYSEELLFFNQSPSYKDTLELEKENEQLKQQVSNLENDLRIIRKNLEALRDGVENGLIEFLKIKEENKQLRVVIDNIDK